MRSSLKLLALALAPILALASNPPAADPRSTLIELRSLAYDANFRNDAPRLRKLSKRIGKLTTDHDVGAVALYYAGWTDWALFNSEYEAHRSAEASAAIQSAADRLRRAVELMPDDADAHSMLANALLGVAIMIPDGFRTVGKELASARRKAVELGPTNPRVVLMDAGMTFGSPPAMGGSQEKGLQRWLEAMDLFEVEARTVPPNPLSPRWGRVLAYGWLCQLYLAMNPQRIADARQAATTALSLRPDFWYVKERILPRLEN